MTKIIFFSKCFQIMLPLRHASLVLQLQVHWPSFELPAAASALLRLFLAESVSAARRCRRTDLPSGAAPRRPAV